MHLIGALKQWNPGIGSIHKNVNPKRFLKHKWWTMKSGSIEISQLLLIPLHPHHNIEYLRIGKFKLWAAHKPPQILIRWRLLVFSPQSSKLANFHLLLISLFHNKEQELIRGAAMMTIGERQWLVKRARVFNESTRAFNEEHRLRDERDERDPATGLLHDGIVKRGRRQPPHPTSWEDLAIGSSLKSMRVKASLQTNGERTEGRAQVKGRRGCLEIQSAFFYSLQKSLPRSILPLYSNWRFLEEDVSTWFRGQPSRFEGKLVLIFFCSSP